jgi:hypothetical protein
MNCWAKKAAAMPTQISSKAIEIRKWLAMMVDSTAKPSQSAAI